MNKLQEAIYFKRVDFSDLFYPQDRRLTGIVSKDAFSNGIKRTRIVLNAQEINEIILAAPKDPQDNIYYKDFQRQLARKELTRTMHKQEINSYTMEKIACAVNEYINKINTQLLTFNDLQRIVRSTWLNISPDELRHAWDILPHDKLSLEKWAKQTSVSVDSFKIPEISKRKEEVPRIMSKLKEIALVYGSSMLIQCFRAKQILYKDDLLSLLEKFRVLNSVEEFNELREWGIDKEIVKRYGNELAFDSETLCQYFIDLDFVEKQTFEYGKPVLDQLVSKTINNIILDKLQSLKKCLKSFTNRDYIEEIRLREVLKSVFPEFTNENISLLINSLRFTILPNREIPFRQINLPEFMSLFDNSEVLIQANSITAAKALPSSNKIETFPSISETFLIKPRDYSWEKALISKVYEVYKPLLANFRLSDTSNIGALTLEAFHFVLKKSLEWLNNEEIYFLVELGIRECGSIDVTRTENIQKDLKKYQESETISAAWYPEGDQYSISYMYFIVVLEKLSHD